ncbi:MAG: ABC transporter permease [Candidatus Marinimicrobia bacterium]|nr:ABC transporter permease [Candidatus Neomarinimicrobiota bacterium]
MSLPYFIAKRHLFSHHKIGYVSFISIISIVGLAVGVAALLLTISILNGFEKEIKTKLISFDAHIRVRLFYEDSIDPVSTIKNEIEKFKSVRSVAPYVHSNVIIRRGNETDGVIIEGIAESELSKTIDIDRFIKEGALQFQTSDGSDGIVVGRKLSQTLEANIGEKVYLFVLHPENNQTSRPKIGVFTVTGIYESGIADYDDIFVYTSLSAAQRLFDLGDRFTGYQILLDDPNQAEVVATQINEQLGYPYHALSWINLHQNLFDWLKVQRIPILLIFGLIALVAVVNVISSLMMIVIEKTHDIGILMAVGVNKKQVTRIFLIEGVLIGLAGTILGFLLALGIAWLQIRFSLVSIPKDVYFMSELPILLDWKNFLVIGIFSMICSTLATIYPTIKAVSLSPSETTRYE